MKSFLEFVNDYLPMLAEKDREPIRRQAQEINDLEDSFPDEQKQIGLELIFKMGTAASGNRGHESVIGHRGGSAPSKVGRAQAKVNSARDKIKAQALGLVPTITDKKGYRLLASGKPLPAHIKEGLNAAIPPAWTDVYINPSKKSCENGCYAVRGRDAAGRTQGLYLKKYRGGQSEAKFTKISELDAKIVRIERENNKNLRSTDKQTRENAAVLRLVMSSAIRPGSAQDTKAVKQAYGATTLEGRHVVSLKKGVELIFTGKKGKDLSIPIDNRIVAYDLLQRSKAVGPKGKLFATDYTSLLSYTKTLDGKGFSPKDFRTFSGTRLAIEKIQSMNTIPKTQKEYKKAVKEVATYVSSKLGNTPTMALQSYISPNVFGSWRGVK